MGTRGLLLLALASSAFSAQAFAFGEDEFLPAPPGALPGECYTKVYVPAVYKSVKERILVAEAHERVEVTQPSFKSVEERVLLREATPKLVLVDANGQPLAAGGKRPRIIVNENGELEIVGAGTETVSRRVLVKEESQRLVVDPPKYRTVKERVLVRPARQVWKLTAANEIYGGAVTNKNGAAITRVDGRTGEVMCLVTEKAEYVSVERRVLDTPARVRTEIVPAIYKTITQTVPKRAYVREISSEPVYKSYNKQVLASTGQEKRTTVDARYKTVSKNVLDAEESVRWVSVLCKVNVTRDKVRDVQRALKRRGFYNGPLDGLVGKGTKAAIDRYQKAKGLVRAGLTIETLESLGVPRR